MAVGEKLGRSTDDGKLRWGPRRGWRAVLALGLDDELWNLSSSRTFLIESSCHHSYELS